MNYERAKALVEQHAPDLLIDEDAGHLHVNVRRSGRSPPHSIMIPTSTAAVPQTDQQLEDTFLASLEAAKAFI
jgi:hypothetical protein